MHGSIRAMPPAFQDLAELEPGLTRLWQDACTAPRSPRPLDQFCGGGEFRGQGFKPRIKELVGWRRGAGPAELCTEAAYNTVTNAILDVLER